MNKSQPSNCQYAQTSQKKLSFPQTTSRLTPTYGKIALGVLLTACMSVVATPSFAFVDAEVAVGQRSGTWKASGVSGKSISSTTIQMAAHLDPIPLVPVSFGLRMISDSYKTTVADHGVKSLTSTAIVPEITAWLPIGDIKPFARLGYTLVSAYKGTIEVVAPTTTSVSWANSSSGPRLAAGIEYSLLPLVSLTAAVEHSMETLTSKAVTVGNVTVASSKTTLTSNAILLGAKVGI